MRRTRDAKRVRGVVGCRGICPLGYPWMSAQRLAAQLPPARNNVVNASRKSAKVTGSLSFMIYRPIQESDAQRTDVESEI
jgi:hypothetical protein